MVNDKKAEELDAKGLYRRAASRWLEVFDLCDTEAMAQEQAQSVPGEMSVSRRAGRYFW